MTRKNFTCKVVNELLEDDFSVIIKNEKHINGYGGWFDSEKKEFWVAMKNKKGFEIMVHEYCHYQQWKTKKRFFNKLIKDGVSVFFDWVDGKFYPKHVVESALANTIELEWDCECRAVDLIKKNNLDIDVDDYCRGTNAYLLYYHAVHSQRKWTKGKSPYSPRICKLMETSIQPLDYYMNRDNISAQLEREYLKVLSK